jgi:hypothetical protein
MRGELFNGSRLRLMKWRRDFEFTFGFSSPSHMYDSITLSALYYIKKRSSMESHVLDISEPTRVFFHVRLTAPMN